MKHYFLIAKDVGDLTAILCAELEDSQAKSDAGAQPRDGASSGRVTRAHAEPRPTTSSSTTTASTSPTPDVFKRDPVNLIRIFHLAQKHNLAFHPDAMRAPPARSS